MADVASPPVLKGTVFAALFDEMREALTEIQNSRRFLVELKAFLADRPDVDEAFGEWQRARQAAPKPPAIPRAKARRRKRS